MTTCRAETPAGELEQGSGDVLALDGVEGAAELDGQLAQVGQPLEPGIDEAVGRRDVDGEQLAAGPRGDLGAAAQQGPALGSAGEGDDDALAGRPRAR